MISLQKTAFFYVGLMLSLLVYSPYAVAVECHASWAGPTCNHTSTLREIECKIEVVGPQNPQQHVLTQGEISNCELHSGPVTDINDCPTRTNYDGDEWHSCKDMLVNVGPIGYTFDCNVTCGNGQSFHKEIKPGHVPYAQATSTASTDCQNFKLDKEDSFGTCYRRDDDGLHAIRSIDSKSLCTDLAVGCPPEDDNNNPNNPGGGSDPNITTGSSNPDGDGGGDHFGPCNFFQHPNFPYCCLHGHEGFQCIEGPDGPDASNNL